jgi:hypothetical protein
MTPAWGLPILMDPRLNGIPNRMGLVSPYLEDYKKELHEIHYEWYKRARNYDVVRLRAAYDAENIRTGQLATRNAALRIERAGKFLQKPVAVPANMDMGFEPDSDEEPVVVTAPLVILAPPEIPLLSREVFFVESVEKYRAYKNADAAMGRYVSRCQVQNRGSWCVLAGTSVRREPIWHQCGRRLTS